MPQSVRLRSAAKEDVHAIRRLIRKARLNPMGVDWKHFIVVASPKNEIVGIGQLRPHRDGSMELASLAVEQEWRGKGIASIIVQHLTSLHAGALYLTCGSTLESFYGRFGFKSINDPQAMPAYFRRVSTLFGLVAKLRRGRPTLLVMKREVS